MRLATVDDILKFIRFDSIDELNDAFDSALVTASVILSSALESDFDKKTAAVDHFYVGNSELIGSEHSTYLETKMGFLEHGSVVVVYGRSKGEVDAGGLDVTSQCLIDHERGKIFLTGIDLTNLWVKVTYNAGFNASSFEPITYVGVPMWLQRLAVSQAILEFDRANPDFRKENSGARINPSELQAHISAALEEHVRYHPYCVRPVM